MEPLTYGSVCSGIEAASQAWNPLGWRASFLSEIEAFPRAVLAARHPHAPLHGDFTTIEAGQYDPIDVLVGGTPCQSFSIAGLRGGMADARGNLALEYLRLADRLRPTWLVWENVPGVLSSRQGRDFGAFLGGLAQLGYGFAWRVLDAQHFGLAQRRKRLFLVGHLGDWRRAAAVLFEPESLRGHPAPRRPALQAAAGTVEASLGRSRGAGTPPGLLASTLTSSLGRRCGQPNDHDPAGGLAIATFAPGLANPISANKESGVRLDLDHDTYIAHAPRVTHTLRGEGHDAMEDGTGRGTPLIALALNANHGGGSGGHRYDPKSETLLPVLATALRARDSSRGVDSDCTDTLLPVAYRFHADGSTAMTGKGQAKAAAAVDVTRALDTCGGFATGQGGNLVLDAGQPQFVHCNKGRPAGRKSAHTPMVGVKPLVETLTTDGHAGSAVFVPAHAFDARQSDVILYGDKTGPLDTLGNSIGIVEPYTLAIRGRADGRHLEYRQDGTANALVSPDGGRDSMGVGAIAFPILEAGARTGESSAQPRAGIGIGRDGDPMFTLQSGKQHAVAFTQNSRSEVRYIGGDGRITGAIAAEHGAQQQNYLAGPAAVRRLTPRECERLQGFPDDYTLIHTGVMRTIEADYLRYLRARHPALSEAEAARLSKDGPRYRALGNSMAVPVMAWIGRRIAQQHALVAEQRNSQREQLPRAHAGPARRGRIARVLPQVVREMVPLA